MRVDKQTKEKLDKVIKACAEEIAQNGANALYDSSQFVTEGRIVITISEAMIPTIEYTRETVCKKALAL